jgi:hypothetical protein
VRNIRKSWNRNRKEKSEADAMSSAHYGAAVAPGPVVGRVRGHGRGVSGIEATEIAKKYAWYARAVGKPTFHSGWWVFRGAA